MVRLCYNTCIDMATPWSCKAPRTLTVLGCFGRMMALRRYSERNLGLAPAYHPGAYLAYVSMDSIRLRASACLHTTSRCIECLRAGIQGSSGYSCCKQTKEDAAGCRPCTRCVLPNAFTPFPIL